MEAITLQQDQIVICFDGVVSSISVSPELFKLDTPSFLEFLIGEANRVITQRQKIVSNLLSAKQACVLSGVTPSTLRTWANRGKITSIRTHGKHRRYLRSEMEKIADEPNNLLPSPIKFNSVCKNV